MAFKIFHKNCCGLDVRKTWIYACIGITDTNNRTEYKQARFSCAGSYLKPLLVQIANALLKSKEHPEFKEHYCRIKARRGHKKAIIALCRMFLTAIWIVLSKCEPYSAKGYLADKLTEHSVVMSKAEGLALIPPTQVARETAARIPAAIFFIFVIRKTPFQSDRFYPKNRQMYLRVASYRIDTMSVAIR